MTSTVYIAKNVYGGDGLGRLGDGRVIFVPGAWAGEQVKAEIIEEKKHFVKARLVEVVEPSAARVEPGPVVPGMVYAGLSDAGELKAKDAQLREFFERARLVAPRADDAAPADLITSAEMPAHTTRYRNKVVYHFARADAKGTRWVMGYRLEPGHEIVDVTDDPLARPEINAKLPDIRKQVFALLTQGADAVRRSVEKDGNVTVRWTARSGVQWWIGRAKQPVVLKEVTCGRVFEVPADGFYQVNPDVGEELAKAVVAEFRKAPTAEILDLYSGVGVFGLCCAAAEKDVRVTGVESGRQAVEFARRNAAAQGVATARFFAEEVGRNTRRLRITRATTVIVDPPRGGMEPNVPRWLAASDAPRILYVSCDPATLVRDLKTLCAVNYAVESVRWFNMFPRTARFETLVVLKHR